MALIFFTHNLFKKLEPELRKSITFDQGKENSEHKELTENTAIAVFFCQCFFLKNSSFISHNVSAVYDVLAARIRKCGAFPGPSKCGGKKPH
jgi:hypothetical protein